MQAALTTRCLTFRYVFVYTPTVIIMCDGVRRHTQTN